MKKGMDKKTSVKILIWYLFGLMFFFAISSTMIGIMVEEITGDYHLTYSQIGMLGSMQGIGGLIATLAGGMISDLFSKKKLIGITFAGFAAVLFLVGFMPPYFLLVMYFLLIGVTSNYLSLLISAVLPELVESDMEFYMNISHAFFGLGSLAGPLYSLIAMHFGLRWNRVFMMLGIICAVILLFYEKMAGKVEEKKTESRMEEGKNSVREILTDMGVIHISLVSLLYMGQQSVVNLWIAAYFQAELGFSGGGIALSLYWTGVMAGRFMTSFISRRIDSKKWLCAGCLISGILWAAALPLHSVWIMFFCLCINGVLTGAAFPVCISAACFYRPYQTGSATAVVCLAGSIGGAVFTWLAGVLAEKVSYAAGLAVIPITLLTCMFLLASLIKSEKSRGVTV